MFCQKKNNEFIEQKKERILCEITNFFQEKDCLLFYSFLWSYGNKNEYLPWLYNKIKLSKTK